MLCVLFKQQKKKIGWVWTEGEIMLVFRAANSLILEYLRNRRGLIWPGTLFHFIGRNKSSPGRGGPVIKTPLQPFNLAGERSKMNLIEHPISLDITYFFLFVLCESREETYKYTCPGKSFPFKKPNRLRSIMNATPSIIRKTYHTKDYPLFSRWFFSFQNFSSYFKFCSRFKNNIKQQ